MCMCVPMHKKCDSVEIIIHPDVNPTELFRHLN